jgi:indoleamine 2,3-dioxygenase
LGPVVPASIAIPLIASSKLLGITPILTYADTVLWNVAPLDPSRPLAPGNLRVLTTFSGTPDEENFYIACADIELYGADALSLMASYENLSLSQRDVASSFSMMRSSRRGVRVETLRSVANGLDQLTSQIGDMTTLLKRCHDAVSPKVFYDFIRPWFRGSSSGAQAWVYEGVSSDMLGPYVEEWDNLSGPSGGQSTLMHALDVFLDVDHALEKLEDDRTSVAARPGNDRLFMHR